MKVVQSYWSWPTNKKSSLNKLDRNNGGWLDKQFNYMSWALSVLNFKKFFSEVELITDQSGFQLLIEKLQLPYTSVKVILDDLNSYHPDLWALGKIRAYQVQDVPFIHADGDVFIWEAFSDSLQNAPLIGQNAEVGHQYYEHPFKHICNNLAYIPEELLTQNRKNGRVISMNAGIIGGADLNFYKEFCERAFTFVDKNIDHLHKIDIGDMNIIFEQVLFAALAAEKGIQISYLFSEVNSYYDGFSDFTAAGGYRKFIHTIGNAKKDLNICLHLKHRLMIDYPQYYLRIMRLLATHQI